MKGGRKEEKKGREGEKGGRKETLETQPPCPGKRKLKRLTSLPTSPTAPHKVLEGVNNVWGRRPTGRATLSSCFKVLRRTAGCSFVVLCGLFKDAAAFESSVVP